MQRGSSITEHLLVGHLSGVGCHLSVGNGVVQFEANTITANVVLDIGDIFAVIVQSIRDIVIFADARQTRFVGHTLPVEVDRHIASGHIVTIDKITGGIVQKGQVLADITLAGHHDRGDTSLVRRTWTSLIVIVHHIDIATARAAIATSGAPVVHQTVAEIDPFGLEAILIFVREIALIVISCSIKSGSTVLHV